MNKKVSNELRSFIFVKEKSILILKSILLSDGHNFVCNNEGCEMIYRPFSNEVMAIQSMLY